MEKGYEIMPIGMGTSVNDILFLICAMSEIRPILQTDGLELHHGIVMLVEDQTDSDILIDFFFKTGAIICKTFAKSIKNIANNKSAIHTYFLYDKEEKLIEFLESESFLPIVIICGAIPDFLKNGTNILPMEKGSLKNLRSHQMVKNLESFKVYARGNPHEIQKSLHFFKTSKIFFKNEMQTPLYLPLMAITDTLGDFYRCSHNESETEQLKIRLRNSVTHFCNLSENYKDDWDILETIKKSIFAYIDDSPQILIDEIDKIEGPLSEAIESDSAILYDAKYYYFPEKILRKACEPLLQTLSFPDIKLELKNSGFLCCNSTATRNFTVKKLITNAYGRTFRVRFLKLLKDFFISEHSLGLEERRTDASCSLEILTKTTAQ